MEMLWGKHCVGEQIRATLINTLCRCQACAVLHDKMTLQILETVRDKLIDCDAVRSNKEFCVSWLAKDESYLRVLRHRKAAPSADALATCASKLAYYAKHLRKSDHPHHQNWAEQFDELRALCEQMLYDNARTKWMTPKRMGL